MKKITIALAVTALFGSLAHAQSPKYGMAGCGLGSLAFKEDKVVEQVLAGTTNGTFYTQTFGISSGTSNCTDDGVVSARRQVPMFIEANQIALANDIARGEGETLAHLSSVLGCNDDARFGSTLQKNYNKIFSTENIKGARVTDSILSTVKSDSALASNCKNMI
jgi:hypothetical protein